MVRFDPRNEAAAVVEFALAELNVKSVKLLNNVYPTLQVVQISIIEF